LIGDEEEDPDNRSAPHCGRPMGRRPQAARWRRNLAAARQRCFMDTGGKFLPLGWDRVALL
jgi:hypothetical protein